MKDIIFCKNLKHNHVYVAFMSERYFDQIFLVTIEDDGIIDRRFFILEWFDEVLGLTTEVYSKVEMEHDQFIGIELGEL